MAEPLGDAPGSRPPHVECRLSSGKATGLVGWGGIAVGVAGQIAYPLCEGTARDALTSGTVVAFFVALVASAVSSSGAARAASATGLAVGLGLAVEAVGVRTGAPFGRYEYGTGLGPMVAGVPAVVPLAWAAMGLAALPVGRRLGRGWRVPLVGGGALAAWDLFLDPQMVADGHWRWLSGGPALPGGNPVTNLAGWLAVSVLLVALLDRMLPETGSSQAIPATFYCWTFAAELLATAAFFHRYDVALVGGLGMGAFAVPYAIRLRTP